MSQPFAFGQQQQLPFGGAQQFAPFVAPAQQDFFASSFGGPAGGGQSIGPSAGAPPVSAGWGDATDFSNEPPLLEELGVNFAHIRRKILAVLMLRRDVDAELLRDADVAGPLAFCVAFGTCLLLAGKLHFDYVYGFGALGCVGMWVVVNLMAPPDRSLDVVGTFSIIGYCLLPLVGLAAVAVLVPLRNAAGGAAAAGAVAWATFASARFFEVALGMSEHRWLLAYPAALLFAAFALITIF